MAVIDIEKELINWLAEHVEIELAILFGSCAKGTEAKDSDIDLAVQLESGKFMCAEQKLNYLTELGRLLNKDIDIIDLNKAGQPLLSQIIKYGKCLIGQKNRYIELVLKNINTTQDFMPYIERMLLERRKKWLDNG